MKKLFVSQIKFIIICGILFFANITPVFAASESEVVYDGEAEKVVTPLGEDLFLNFKSMLPGDETKQVIKISNTLEQTVAISLRAENADASKFESEEVEAISNEILKLLELELVITDSYGIEKKIYTGVASEAVASEDGTGIKLGSFIKGYEGQLVAKLKVPETLGNKYAGKEAKVKWIFSMNETVKQFVEEKDKVDVPVNPDVKEDINKEDDTTPSGKTAKVLAYVESKVKTGDIAQIGVYMLLIVASGGISCILLKKKRKSID